MQTSANPGPVCSKEEKQPKLPDHEARAVHMAMLRALEGEDTASSSGLDSGDDLPSQPRAPLLTSTPLPSLPSGAIALLDTANKLDAKQAKDNDASFSSSSGTSADHDRFSSSSESDGDNAGYHVAGKEDGDDGLSESDTDDLPACPRSSPLLPPSSAVLTPASPPMSIPPTSPVTPSPLVLSPSSSIFHSPMSSSERLGLTQNKPVLIRRRTI